MLKRKKGRVKDKAKSAKEKGNKKNKMEGGKRKKGHNSKKFV
jgi:hypothetical protein